MTENTYPHQDVELDEADIEIGAVEIKDSQSDRRAAVDADQRLCVSVGASSLPTGAATESTLALTAKESGGNLAACAQALASLDAKLSACNTAAVSVSAQPDARLKTDGALLSLSTMSKTVSSSGTAEPLAATSTPCWRADILAKTGNSGKIYIGGADVHHGTLPAVALQAGEAYSLDCPAGCRIDLSNVYLDADVNGEGVIVNLFAISA